MTIRTSSFSGSGAGFKLAPDLSFIGTRVNTATPRARVNVDPSGGLTTALSFSGKHSISVLYISNTIAESFTVKLTIDGVIIINETFTADANGISLFGGGEVGAVFDYLDIVPIFNNSFLLEIQSTTDTSVDVDYLARPIL